MEKKEHSGEISMLLIAENAERRWMRHWPAFCDAILYRGTA
jgi:hypothetical protein